MPGHKRWLGWGKGIVFLDAGRGWELLFVVVVFVVGLD